MKKKYTDTVTHTPTHTHAEEVRVKTILCISKLKLNKKITNIQNKSCGEEKTEMNELVNRAKIKHKKNTNTPKSLKIARQIEIFSYFLSRYRDSSAARVTASERERRRERIITSARARSQAPSK